MRKQGWWAVPVEVAQNILGETSLRQPFYYWNCTTRKMRRRVQRAKNSPPLAIEAFFGDVLKTGR